MSPLDQTTNHSPLFQTLDHQTSGFIQLLATVLSADTTKLMTQLKVQLTLLLEKTSTSHMDLDQSMDLNHKILSSSEELLPKTSNSEKSQTLRELLSTSLK